MDDNNEEIIQPFSETVTLFREQKTLAELKHTLEREKEFILKRLSVIDFTLMRIELEIKLN